MKARPGVRRRIVETTGQEVQDVVNFALMKRTVRDTF
jgi:hypothetical protein